jgi:hypothetical protein
MLIEYRIRFEGGGVTVKQRIDPGGSSRTKKLNLNTSASGQGGKSLGSSFAGNQSSAEEGSGEADPTETGGYVPGTKPVIIFGPIIVGACPSDDDTGGGEADPTDPGGNR